MHAFTVRVRESDDSLNNAAAAPRDHGMEGKTCQGSQVNTYEGVKTFLGQSLKDACRIWTQGPFGSQIPRVDTKEV